MPRPAARLLPPLIAGAPLLALLTPSAGTPAAEPPPFPVVDTMQDRCYPTDSCAPCPQPGEPTFGQDAQHRGTPASYRDDGDGTVLDRVTGLRWEQGHRAERLGWYDAAAACSDLELGGFDDWRLPSITELFSLADFRGSVGERPYLDPEVFDIAPPTNLSDRVPTHFPEMMGQTWSGTIYAGDHWGRGVEAAFFFNFLDGRIKQAPTRGPIALFTRCVRGAPYGGSDPEDRGDGTVLDRATGLQWQQADDAIARDWPSALAACEALELGGHDDWRLPDVKELQSLVDYTRAAPALDTDAFALSDPDAWFWSSTTHGDHHGMAAYVCFGACSAVDGTDTHGAGAQRSDPKTGDPSLWPPMGGQRDAVRIRNLVRCVRGGAGLEPDAGQGACPASRADRPLAPEPPQHIAAPPVFHPRPSGRGRGLL